MRYTQWEDIQTQLGELYKSTDPGARTLTDSLEGEAEKLEKDLSARSENFARISDRKRFTWHDVQKKLKAGEAVVEMVRINRYGLDAGITDSSDERYPVYHQFGASDSVVYAALLVWPGAAIPKLVILENGNQMEGKWGHYYQNCILNQLPDPHSFGRYWKKIVDQLGPGIKRIYFSPDGIYHAINLNTLFNPKSKKFVVEERDIRLVTSTKDLLKTGVEENYNKLAYVLGYPDYWKGKARAVDNPTGNRGADLSPLPGTRMEANLISSLLQSKNWEVIELLEDKAVEEALKESYKPKVMHIATHGFFHSDSGQKTNPLLRSGLLLAGAANTLVGSKTETGEDGILTAYEAMNLNLDNTDLVVLSACETGLGEIKNGQGVFGLQRAFQVAGAKSLIMSLWKINDQTTQELMVSFYKHWLGQANSGLHAHSGKSKLQKEMRKPSPVSKRAAFLAAQKELKIKYPDPYYWGAFIMVGE